ncbi:MAG: cell wall hydrolase, partial [Pseudomonadota bacterium]
MQNTIETMGDIDILARTIYGEARGEYGRVDGGLAALIAVGNVIVNRTQQQTWFGRTVRDVCLKPYQFSCWNRNDPNLPKLMEVTDE